MSKHAWGTSGGLECSTRMSFPRGKRTSPFSAPMTFAGPNRQVHGMLHGMQVICYMVCYTVCYMVCKSYVTRYVTWCASHMLHGMLHGVLHGVPVVCYMVCYTVCYMVCYTVCKSYVTLGLQMPKLPTCIHFCSKQHLIKQANLLVFLIALFWALS